MKFCSLILLFIESGEYLNACYIAAFVFADLSKNKLSEFPAELGDFVMIEKVNLYHNTIRGVPESQLSELKFLRVLNLRWVTK